MNIVDEIISNIDYSDYNQAYADALNALSILSEFKYKYSESELEAYNQKIQEIFTRCSNNFTLSCGNKYNDKNRQVKILDNIKETSKLKINNSKNNDSKNNDIISEEDFDAVLEDLISTKPILRQIEEDSNEPQYNRVIPNPNYYLDGDNDALTRTEERSRNIPMVEVFGGNDNMDNSNNDSTDNKNNDKNIY